MVKLEQAASVHPDPDTDAMSTSPMDASGLRSALNMKRTRAKDRDWKVVTAITIEDMHSDSQFFGSNPARPLPFFDAKEIHIGLRLGVGEFGVVYEVTRVTDDSKMKVKELMQQAMASPSMAESLGVFRDDGSSGEDEAGRGDMASAIEEAEEKRGIIRELVWREGKARYAVKRLKDGMDEGRRLDASVDLAAEREFLASISHPNIIRLRGTVGAPGHPEFMLIMDRLHVPMNKRLQEWKQDVRACMGPLGMTVRRKKQFFCLLSERVIAAYDVARALNFLHGHNILYRDLKPENVGFDVRGDVRLFDFGIARELKPKDLIKAPDDYRCTGLTGSRRWMAPEVCLCKPYGLKADVYSYGLFFYQLCSLKLPFGKITPDWHITWVVKKDTRPKIPLSVPRFLRDTMKACWSPKPSDRPSFQDICNRLPDSMNSTEILDRSTHLLDRSKHSAAERGVDGIY